MAHHKEAALGLLRLGAAHRPLSRWNSSTLIERCLATLALWRRRRRDRRVLAALDDRLLRDIGVSPDDAARECAKPFWR